MSTRRDELGAVLLSRALLGFGWLLWRLPPVFSRACALGLTTFWNVFLPIRRQVARENLESAMGIELDVEDRLEIVKRMVYNLSLNYLELLTLPFIGTGGVVSRFRWRGLQELDNALGAGRGALILSAHLGAFDLLACATAARGYPVTIISRTPRSSLTRAVWMGYRSAAGVHILPERGSLREVLKALRAGGLVVLVLDQNMHRDRGVFVDFFGRPACTLDSLAVIAMRTGAPVVPAFTWRSDDGMHEAVFMPPVELARSGDAKVDIIKNTQRFTELLEQQVRAHPEQWLWLHRRWRTQQEPASADMG